MFDVAPPSPSSSTHTTPVKDNKNGSNGSNGSCSSVASRHGASPLTPAQAQRGRKAAQAFWRQARARCGACASFDEFAALSGALFAEAREAGVGEDAGQAQVLRCVELIASIVRQRFDDINSNSSGGDSGSDKSSSSGKNLCASLW
jgi:hypothetical protein